ncbi:MAG: hypothetical protein ACRDI2_11075, partial [Chloroflexota bacterium]
MRRRHLAASAIAQGVLLTTCARAASQPDAQPDTAAPTAPAASAASAASATPATSASFEMQEYPVPRRSRPHDVAPAPDGGVWYTGQASGELGYLDPATGDTRQIKLGDTSAPHGVI